MRTKVNTFIAFSHNGFYGTGEGQRTEPMRSFSAALKAAVPLAHKPFPAIIVDSHDCRWNVKPDGTYVLAFCPAEARGHRCDCTFEPEPVAQDV